MAEAQPQFVAVPVEVLRVAQDHAERMALMDLALMADEARWEPFPASERYLVQRWKLLRLGSTKVRRLLAALVEVGWLRVLEPEARHLPRKLQMRRATRAPEGVPKGQADAQDGNAPHNAGSTHPTTHPTTHDDSDQTGNLGGDDAPHNAPHNAGPTHPATRNSQSNNQNSRGNNNSPKPPPPPAEGAQGQLDLMGPDQVLAQVEGMLEQLGVSASAVKAPARAALAAAGLVSVKQLAKLSPKQLRAQTTNIGPSTVTALRQGLQQVGLDFAEEPKQEHDPRPRWVGSLWSRLWKLRTNGEPYVWAFMPKGSHETTKDHRAAEALVLMASVGKDDGPPPKTATEPLSTSLDRLERAMEAYIAAVDAGEVFKVTHPTFTDFTRRAQVYLQVADGDVGAAPRAQGPQGFTDMQDEARAYRDRMLSGGGSVTPLPTLKVV